MAKIVNENQISLFGDFKPAPVVSNIERLLCRNEPVTGVEDIYPESKLLTDIQRVIIRDSPYFHFFKDKTLAEIEKIHKKSSPKMFAESHKSEQSAKALSDWYNAMFSGETLAIEQEYLKRDERYLGTFEGDFNLFDAAGKVYKLNFTFELDKGGITVPKVNLRFHSEGATPISSTGFRSYLNSTALIDGVKKIEDFIEIVALNQAKGECSLEFTRTLSSIGGLWTA